MLARFLNPMKDQKMSNKSKKDEMEKDEIDAGLDTESTDTEGAEDEEPKGRPDHPSVGSEDKDIYPFRYPAERVEAGDKLISEADPGNFPADYDFATHAGLRKKDFGNDFSYFTYKAKRAEHEAKKFTAKAEEALKLGGITTDGDAKKFLRIAGKLDELREVLAAKGLDPNELLQQLLATKAPKA